MNRLRVGCFLPRVSPQFRAIPRLDDGTHAGYVGSDVLPLISPASVCDGGRSQRPRSGGFGANRPPRNFVRFRCNSVGRGGGGWAV